MVSTSQLVALLVAPLVALACEGECIVNITKEYLRLYYPVTLDVFQNMADKIDAHIVPPDNRREDSISYFTPVFDAYNKVAYGELEHAIFPSHFHGKCRYGNGTVPDGCPNPDCPVVCGTPGSMVHFFPDLTRITFDELLGLLTNLTSPKSKPYRQVETMVLADASKTRRSRLSRKRRAQETSVAEKRFRVVMKDFPAMFLTACGGWNLSQCSWEPYMKEYILRFP